jgi:hypothetical protein
MSRDEHVVCIAVDNNDRAWYEMLLPFILSLRQTDYDGAIVVIGYGLSEKKQRLLEEQAISLIAASAASPLSVDRFIEAAEYCANHKNVKKLALYDAGTWFCASRFDLFACIVDDKIYSCHDPHFGEDIVSLLIDARRAEDFRLAVDRAHSSYGGMQRVGLVAGTAAAWERFLQLLRYYRARFGPDFDTYQGIDATILQLCAISGEVAQLDVTQNFEIKNGARELTDESHGCSRFKHLASPIRAVRTAQDSRFFHRWRFYNNYADSALRDGREFALSSAALARTEQADLASQPLQSVGLAFMTCSIEHCSGSYLQMVDEPGGAMLIGAGNHEIVLEAIRDIPQLYVYAMHPSGLPSPLIYEVEVGGETFRKKNHAIGHFSTSVSAGATISLLSTSLGGQLCSAIWRLREQPDMEW